MVSNSRKSKSLAALEPHAWCWQYHSARIAFEGLAYPRSSLNNPHSELQTIVSSAIVQQLRLIPLGLEDALETTWEWLQRPAADLGTGKVAAQATSHLGR